MVDQQTEVRHFFNDRAAHWGRGYAAGGSMEPRVARFCELALRRAAPGARVLDYGCGTGQLARALAERGFVVTGADISEDMLSTAQREASSSAVQWRQLDQRAGAPLPFAAGAFDLIVSSSVLEYVADLGLTFSELRRVLAERGWLLSTVPDPAHASRRVEDLVRRGMRIPGARRLLERTRLSAYVRYLGLSVNRFPLERWRELLQAHGFRLEATHGNDALALLEAQRQDGR